MEELEELMDYSFDSLEGVHIFRDLTEEMVIRFYEGMMEVNPL